MRHGVLIPGLIAIAAAIVLAFFYALRTETPPPVAISPTPTATATASPSSPTPAARATPSPSPSPTAAAGRHVNASMLFSIELRPPWHQAICGPTRLGPADGAQSGVDVLIPVPDRGLTLGDTGGLPADQITVLAVANPQGMTPRQWKESGRAGAGLGERLEDTTLAGRTALLVSERDNETFLVANAGYMYAVGHQARTATTSKAERGAIVRTFQFLGAQEARAAASPAPAPRSPEAVADALAEGFAKKDISILAPVAVECLGEGGAQAGIGRKDTQSFLDGIRDRFARGLTVEVQARPLMSRQDSPGYFFVKAIWREPGQPDRDSDLRILVERDIAYWDSVVYYSGNRP